MLKRDQSQGRLTELNTFVVVRPDDATRACPFWIGQVLKLKKNSYGDVCTLSVQWNEVGGADVFDGKYSPSMFRAENGTLKKWVGEISTDTVMFQMEGLTRKGHLGRTTVRRIQAALNSYVTDA